MGHGTATARGSHSLFHSLSGLMTHTHTHHSTAHTNRVSKALSHHSCSSEALFESGDGSTATHHKRYNRAATTQG
jgi:hypothetical protein